VPHAFGGENSVTILRLVRSSLQRLHRYENLQLSHIPESVAGFALSWLCAIQFRLCSRRRSGKQFFTASRTSWRRRRRTLWTWRRTRTGREISISRTLTVRRPRCRESSYKVSARFCGNDLAGTDPFQREKRRTQRAMGNPTRSGCPIGPVM